MSVRSDADRNSFKLTAEEVSEEYFLRARSGVYGNCGMFQLIEQPQPDNVHGHYAFSLCISRFMQLHFENFANAVMKDVLAGRASPQKVELGSNDGIRSPAL